VLAFAGGFPRALVDQAVYKQPGNRSLEFVNFRAKKTGISGKEIYNREFPGKENGKIPRKKKQNP